SIMNPLEKEEGYDPNYAVAVNICSAPTGIIIPPSGPLILYSITAGGVSVAALFMGGYIPGILLGLCVMAVAIFMANKRGYKASQVKDDAPVIKILIDAIPSLLAVVIVMAGILLGWFTPTEAGVVCVLYCGALGFIYKELTLKNLYELLADTMESSATILFLISASTIMSFVMTASGIPAAISAMIMGASSNKYVILLIMNVFLLVMGMFLDLTPAVLIFTPIFLPIINSIGMSPVHFGIMLILNLGIGSVTPPVGSCLFVGCGVGKVTIDGVTKYIVPMFVAMVVALLLVTYIPGLCLFIPKLCGLI
ncbi:MAG: TRAP transporter large permease, partial [Muricoprocola sp.]